MQIYVFDRKPAKAAQYHCDVHACKMILETAQILCSALVLNGKKNTPYRPTHSHHPCVLWAASSVAHFVWLLDLGFSLSEEYEMRFGRVHASFAVVEWASNAACNAPRMGFTGFVQAIPSIYRSNDPIASYRAYYLAEKAHFANYRAPRTFPDWFPHSPPWPS